MPGPIQGYGNQAIGGGYGNLPREDRETTLRNYMLSKGLDPNDETQRSQAIKDLETQMGTEPPLQFSGQQNNGQVQMAYPMGGGVLDFTNYDPVEIGYLTPQNQNGGNGGFSFMGMMNRLAAPFRGGANGPSKPGDYDPTQEGKDNGNTTATGNGPSKPGDYDPTREGQSLTDASASGQGYGWYAAPPRPPMQQGGPGQMSPGQNPWAMQYGQQV